MTRAVTPTAHSGRASALHRRAMARAAEPDQAGAPRAGTIPRIDGSPIVPGAGALAVAAVGFALGLAATAAVVGRSWDPGAVASGPWVTSPKAGTPAIDPYARAAFARTGAVPLAASEGLSLTAATDDTGYKLLRTCSYRLSGDVPPARFWTLTATDKAGTTLDGAAGRSAFTSTEVVRDAAGRFTVEVGPQARPGNWLPLSGAGPLVLTLRLYDTPLTGDAAEIAASALPAIARQRCEGAQQGAYGLGG